MPTLILSSSYNTESKILRSAAEALHWETFRFQGDQLPEWYEPGNKRHAIYCTVPRALQVARRLDSMLLGCSSEWMIDLAEEFSRRSVRLLHLAEARQIHGRCFIKPALGKSFDAAVRTGSSLVSTTAHLPADLLVHVSEEVRWEVEYRCFIKEREVMTLSPYRRGKAIFSSYASPLQGPNDELAAAAEFAGAVVKANSCPRAFVLDVGMIRGRGWAVVEPNECWGAGIYGCTPAKVLEVLLAATVRKGETTKEDRAWDYAEHYFRACPHMKDPRNW